MKYYKDYKDIIAKSHIATLKSISPKNVTKHHYFLKDLLMKKIAWIDLLLFVQKKLEYSCNNNDIVCVKSSQNL